MEVCIHYYHVHRRKKSISYLYAFLTIKFSVSIRNKIITNLKYCTWKYINYVRFVKNRMNSIDDKFTTPIYSYNISTLDCQHIKR